MRTAVLICFFATFALNSCQRCSTIKPVNLSKFAYLAGPLLNRIKDTAKGLIPVFNKYTVPHLDSLVEKFKAASDNEDIHLNITQLLHKYGYKTESYQVNSDGYLLDIFRIPGNGKPVLIIHGLFSSADDYVSTGPDRALAYELANQGYDVWLGNVRGTKYGRKHVTLSPDCAEFWDFSWEEIARYDLPAIIDHVLKTTGEEKLAFVGHSQGSTTFFAMMSDLPEYNDKISVMIAFGPVVYMKHSTAPVFNLLAPIVDPFYSLSKAIGFYEFAGRNPITDLITSTACDTPASATLFCNNLFFIVFGFDYQQVNATILPVAFGHFPSGSATKQTIHYLQLINSGKFHKFDYGTEKNLEIYHSTSPPEYDLGKVTSKVAIFYSDNDYFTGDIDRGQLERELPNVIESYRVPLASFAHGDYLFANDLKTLVNDKVVEIINKHTSK